MLRWATASVHTPPFGSPRCPPFQDLTKPPTPIIGKHALGVSMTASMSRGEVMTEQEWGVVERACKVAWELREAREKVSRSCDVSEVRS